MTTRHHHALDRHGVADRAYRETVIDVHAIEKAGATVALNAVSSCNRVALATFTEDAP